MLDLVAFLALVIGLAIGGALEIRNATGRGHK